MANAKYDSSIEVINLVNIDYLLSVCYFIFGAIGIGCQSLIFTLWHGVVLCPTPVFCSVQHGAR